MTKYLLCLSLFVLLYSEGICQSRKVNNAYENGQIKKGYKVGVWNYKGLEGDTELSFDYDQGSIQFLKPDTSEYLILLDSAWIWKKLARHPRYLGSYHEFYEILGANLKYPEEARRKGIQATVLLEFEISPQGQATQCRILNDEENYFGDEILETFALIPNLWIEAIYKGKRVATKFILPFRFGISGREDAHQIDEAALASLEAKRLSEIVVIAYNR